MSKTVKCIIRQDWETRNASGELLDRQRRVYVTNEDGTPHIYNSLKEARAEIIANYGHDANKNGILHSHSAEDYSGNIHDGYVYIIREDSEEYAEAIEQAEQATAETLEAISAPKYAAITKSGAKLTFEQATELYTLRTDFWSWYELAQRYGITEADAREVFAMAKNGNLEWSDEEGAPFGDGGVYSIHGSSDDFQPEPEPEEPARTGYAELEPEREPVTLDKFSSEPVDEYGEAYHFIDLTKGTTAYQYETKNKYLYTIGHSAEFGEWVAEIDDEYGYLAVGQGATRQTALENVCIDAVAADAMRKNPNCEDAVNVIAGEAYHLLNAHYPDTSDPEQREQYARMLEMSTEYVKRYGVFYEIKWEPYQVADADQDATAEAAADAREAWSGEGIYRVMWSDGGQPYEPAYYGSLEDLTADLLAAYESATETHLPYAEPISAYHRYELEAYLGEPADYDVDAIEAATTARTAAGLQFWTADAETLAAVAEAYQTAEYIPA